MTTIKDDGGVAFPQMIDTDGQPAFALCGMSLRDYFAAQALIGLVDWQRSEKTITRQAYRLADAMLEARKERT
jgi:hypothetical protein